MCPVEYQLEEGINEDGEVVPEVWQRKNLDLAPEKLTARWIAETGYQAERPNWFKRLISRIRLYLRQRGWFVHHLTDDDIASVLYRAARAGRRTDGVRMSTDENGEVRRGTDKGVCCLEAVYEPKHSRKSRL